MTPLSFVLAFQIISQQLCSVNFGKHKSLSGLKYDWFCSPTLYPISVSAILDFLKDHTVAYQSSIGHTSSCDVNSQVRQTCWHKLAFLVCSIHINGNPGYEKSSVIVVWLTRGKVLSDLMDCGSSQLQILDAQHVSDNVLGDGGHFSGRIHVLDLFGLFHHQRQQTLLKHVVHSQYIQLVEINLCKKQMLRLYTTVKHYVWVTFCICLIWFLHIPRTYATHENEYRTCPISYMVDKHKISAEREENKGVREYVLPSWVYRWEVRWVKSLHWALELWMNNEVRQTERR